LFDFITNESSEAGDLNPVLAGYFTKLINTFINRRPKQIFTYLFEHSAILDKFVFHIALKSISELLVKVLTGDDNNFDVDAPIEEFKALKYRILNDLIEKLGPSHSDEDHLNVVSVIGELCEQKSLFDHFVNDFTLDKLFEFVKNTENESSTKNALQILTVLSNSLKNKS
jgi:serine/threonine-protein phosphatase 6 regulatory subunit 1